MKKLFLILAFGALLSACDQVQDDEYKDSNNNEIENPGDAPEGGNVYNKEDMTVDDIIECADALKANHPTTPEDFDAFMHAMCNDLVLQAMCQRLVYKEGAIKLWPGNEVLADGIMSHSLMSNLLFFEDGTCWQCYYWMSVGPGSEAGCAYCPLEWTADRNTQTIKLVSPCLKAKGGEHAETEMKLVAFGPHPYFGENIYLVEGLQPYEEPRWGEDFAQYFIDATPNPQLRSQIIAEYKPHE